jgi:hypothetical protein
MFTEDFILHPPFIECIYSFNKDHSCSVDLFYWGITNSSDFNECIANNIIPNFILSLINPAVVNAGMDEVGFELTGHRPNGALSFKYGTEYYICFYMENGGYIEYVLALTKFR